MIVFIEPQCKDWEHNRVNSELIRQFNAAFPNDELKLYADEKHNKNISALLSQYSIQIEYENIEIFDYHGKNEEKVDDYEAMIEAVLDRCKNIQKIVFLSCNKGILLALGRVARRFPIVSFICVFHSAMEEVCIESRKKTIKQFVYEVLWTVVNMKRIPEEEKCISMRECIDSCNVENCRFVIYSPCFREVLSKYLSESILNKIYFLHHPFYDSCIENSVKSDERTIIGLYGQALNDNARKLIKLFNKKFDNSKVLFKVKTKQSDPIFEEKNVERLFEMDYVSNEELEEAISKFDYILIPYDSNQYRVTASGIFCDAVSQGVPAMTLSSPYFKYYDKYGAVIVETSIGRLARKIKTVSEDKSTRNRIVTKEKELKTRAFQDNIETLRTIV